MTPAQLKQQEVDIARKALGDAQSDLNEKEAQLNALLNSGKSWIHMEIDAIKADIVGMWDHLWPWHPVPTPAPVTAPVAAATL